MASGWGSSGYASNPFAGGAGGPGGAGAPPPPSAPGAPWAPASGAAATGVPPAMVAAAATAAAKDKRVRTGVLAALGLGGGSTNATDDARELELSRREAAIRAREAELGLAPGAQAPGGILPASARAPANWPPCVPLIRHSIADGVVPWHRPMVRFAYLVELLEIGAFFFNAIVLLAALIAGVSAGLTWWLISVLALCLGVPGSWLLWYKCLWSAANSNGGTYAFARELILLLINVAWCVLCIVAPRGIADWSAGVIPMLGLFQRNDTKGTVFAIFYIINIALWGGVAFGSWVVVGLAIRAYRQGGDPAREYEARYGAPATVVV
jgi:secretory carrier-associated membrane protein